MPISSNHQVLLCCGQTNMQHVAHCDNSHKWEYTDILIELAEDQASVKPMVVGYYDALQGILQTLWGGRLAWNGWDVRIAQMFHCTNRSLSWTLTFALWGIYSHSFLPDEMLDMLHCEVGQISIKIKCQVAVGLITRIMKSRKVRMCQSLLSCDPSSWVELQHLLSQVTSNSGCLWEPRSQWFSLLTYQSTLYSYSSLWTLQKQ